jgi:hypothetical protein
MEEKSAICTQFNLKIKKIRKIFRKNHRDVAIRLLITEHASKTDLQLLNALTLPFASSIKNFSKPTKKKACSFEYEYPTATLAVAQ